MSIDATRWAWKASLKPASLKLVLLSLADRADENHCAYPSVKRLTADTGLDRKTVLEAMDKLQKHGVLEDTGKRKGRTKSVKVWQLLGVVGRHDDDDAVESIPRINARAKAVPKTVPLSSPENGTPKAVPKTGSLSSPKNGTGSGTENGTPKQSRKRDTESISRNLSVEPSPLTPQDTDGGEGLSVPDEDQKPKSPPDRMPQDFPEQVQEIYNRVAEKHSNACGWNNIKLDHTLAIKRLYLDRDMKSISEWEDYLDSLMSSRFGKSMTAITAKFALKDDTVCNCMDGVYAKTSLSRD